MDSLYIRNLFCVLLFFVSLAAYSQNPENLYENAEKEFYKEELGNALLIYEKVLKKDPDFKDAEYKAEICSLLTIYREKQIDKLLAFAETHGKADRFYKYWLGRVYVSRYLFEEAVQAWREFLAAKTRKSPEIREETKDFIADARIKIDFFENTDDYEIHQLGGLINTKDSELTPVYFEEKQELLFMSSRESQGSEAFKVFHSIKQEDGWTDITEIKILGAYPEESANLQVVNEDGKLFLFKEEKKGGLYFSETANGRWVRPVEFDSKLGSTHIKSHFFINEHEDRIIFSTNKDVKNKGLDLYQSFRNHETGKWSKPAPFADVINSMYDEDSPYLSPDEKTLYFSSNGHASIGGFDVFRTEFDSMSLTWSEPENLGFPINSPDNEVHFKLNIDGTSGYFSSDRLHSKGEFDIYFFWEIEKINIEGRVFDVAAKMPIDDAVIRFTPSQYTDEHFKSELDPNGKYKTEIISDEIYLVEILRNGKTIFTDNFEIHETGGVNTTYIKDFLFNQPKPESTEPIETVSISETPVTSPQVKPEPKTDKQVEETPRVVRQVSDLPKDYSVNGKAIIHNIYFGFGTAGLSRSANPVLEELEQVLKANPKLRIQIGGHTDSIGPEDANQWISENRAKSVKNWLVQRGISRDRLVAVGFGESQPLASNDDEVNGRELNRRIEVLVIK